MASLLKRFDISSRMSLQLSRMYSAGVGERSCVVVSSDLAVLQPEPATCKQQNRVTCKALQLEQDRNYNIEVRCSREMHSWWASLRAVPRRK